MTLNKEVIPPKVQRGIELNHTTNNKPTQRGGLVELNDITQLTNKGSLLVLFIRPVMYNCTVSYQ